jgi:hypothetical protein
MLLIRSTIVVVHFLVSRLCYSYFLIGISTSFIEYPTTNIVFEFSGDTGADVSFLLLLL